MRAGAQTRTKSLQEPLPRHGDAGSKAVFQNCRMSGGGPPPTWAAALAWKTPSSRTPEASRPRAPGTAGPGTRLGFSPHSLDIRGRSPGAGLWGSHATGATPPKSDQCRRASSRAQAPPRPGRQAPPPPFFPHPGATWSAATTQSSPSDRCKFCASAHQ